MQRKLGIKRSFHFDDLRSIVGLDQHHAQQVEEDVSASQSSRKRVKRQRAISTDLSSCSALCYCCDEEEGEKSAKFMFSAAAIAASNDDSLMSKSSSPARLISPATSHVAVTTPELNPARPCDELSSLPCFPSLGSRNESSSDFPATAALERFMLKQRPSSDDLEVDFSPSFEEEQSDEEESYQVWPKFDDQREDLSSPRQVEGFPWQARRVSMTSRKSSTVSVSDSSSHGLSNQGQSPVSFLSMSSSSCKLEPAKSILSQRPVPTVNEIAEALSRI